MRRRLSNVGATYDTEPLPLRALDVESRTELKTKLGIHPLINATASADGKKLGRVVAVSDDMVITIDTGRGFSCRSAVGCDFTTRGHHLVEAQRDAAKLHQQARAAGLLYADPGPGEPGAEHAVAARYGRMLRAEQEHETAILLGVAGVEHREEADAALRTADAAYAVANAISGAGINRDLLNHGSDRTISVWGR